MSLHRNKAFMCMVVIITITGKQMQTTHIVVWGIKIKLSSLEWLICTTSYFGLKLNVWSRWRTFFLNVQFSVGTPPFVLLFDWINIYTKMRHDWLEDKSVKPSKNWINQFYFLHELSLYRLKTAPLNAAPLRLRLSDQQSWIIMLRPLCLPVGIELGFWICAT